MLRSFKWVIIGIPIFLTGCATIVNGRYVDVPIETNPGGATIKVDGKEYISPAVANIRRRREGADITIEKEGYKTEKIHLQGKMSGWVMGNMAIFIIGMAFGGVDFGTGAAYYYDPDEISLQLKPTHNRPKPKTPLNRNNPVSLSVSTRLSSENWFPFSEKEMLSAVRDKAISVLSQSGFFHIEGEGSNEAKATRQASGNVHFDLVLLEKIELAKLKVSLDLPDGTTYVISESESLSGKNYEEIFGALEKLGSMSAKRLLQLFSY